MRLLAIPALLALMLSVAPAPTALAGEIGVCAVWEEGIAIVCVSEFAMSGTEDGRCSQPNEFYWGTDSAFVALGDRIVVLDVNGVSECYRGEDGSAYASESFGTYAAAGDGSLALGWTAWSSEDGAGGSDGDCAQWATVSVADERAGVEPACEGGRPPASPRWGQLVP